MKTTVELIFAVLCLCSVYIHSRPTDTEDPSYPGELKDDPTILEQNIGKNIKCLTEGDIVRKGCKTRQSVNNYQQTWTVNKIPYVFIQNNYRDIHEYSSTHNMNESGSSGSEAITRESGYLNPYQPIVHSADIHEYSSTNNMNESGSSGSETTTPESGYLNPYQPMVPDRDLHDYKSVLDSTVGSDSGVSDECTKEIFVHSYQDLESEIDTHEYKSVCSMSIDTVTKDDSSNNVQIKNRKRIFAHGISS
ncbi:Hypothetical predicted protein [Mytilus galloprovincialis]|uniref:Uncharacterized protein n=1 Tax=Mytilus galloprovincialis TaxID=29158 RepID=A0A8B6EFE4_MYTGA|nr:Hypothetical predicted protein [Mytilus galloprovincialis]